MELTTKPIRAGINRAFITLPSATLEGYTTPGGIIVQPDYHKRQEDKAAVIGTVVSASCFGLKEGDKVAVNYAVTSTGKQHEGYFEHSNCYVIGDQMVWEAADFNLIAVERDGQWEALGKHVLLKKVIIPNDISSVIILPEYLQNVEVRNRGILVDGVDEQLPDLTEGPLNIPFAVPPIGSTVLYEDGFSDLYKFDNGEEFLILFDKRYCLAFIRNT